jgi:hypothetical protein
MAAKFINLVGQTFGWLTVKSHAGFTERRQSKWKLRVPLWSHEGHPGLRPHDWRNQKLRGMQGRAAESTRGYLGDR